MEVMCMESIFVLNIGQFTRVFTSFEKAEEYLKGSFTGVERAYSPAAPWVTAYEIGLIKEPKKLSAKIVRFDSVDFDPKPNEALGFCESNDFESVESSL